ncbi:non-ribosomal peptide synthase domain TIGR01720/amino acid adenylation domain-containing protein [Delftia tsuruhatensis]|uniref:non-ribosomal peptide synthetase n=1 Tax=Delftia tsuruhatensis TaxID=180282 RepID=UPI0008E5100C|nr:non-ribosomal peptide synthetase [Delftia tsuruhatensis]SFA91721.1 non-ribosomal peptide synthase domain TIGR01720/amino acid adenylation domain-containing protein [Delftia tsuruhatensis]
MDRGRLRQIAERFASLSPAQRTLALQKIRAEGLDLSHFPIPVRAPSPDQTEALSHAQLRQWFLWKLDPQSSAYHIAQASWMHGELDLAALRQAFGVLLERHGGLRTVFEESPDGLARQRIVPQLALELPLIDLSSLPAAQRRERALAEAERLCLTPFDLTRGPLLRVAAVRLDSRQHLLVVVMHHIISDGRSMQILLEEFAGLYAALVQQRPTRLPPLPIAYTDYAAWQRDWLEAGERQRLLDYWLPELAGGQDLHLELPADHARAPGAETRWHAAWHRLELPTSLVAGLEQRAREQGTSLFVALLAGFQALLHRYTAETDIRVGVPVANRNQPEAEPLVGFFVNTLVMRGRLDPRMRLQELLAQLAERVRLGLAHQDLPYEQLVEALQPRRSLDGSSLFQVMLNYQHEEAAGLAGLEIQKLELDGLAAQFELTLHASRRADGSLQLGFAYARERFEPATVQRMGAHLSLLLQALAHAPQCALDQVQLLPGDEQAQLLDRSARRSTRNGPALNPAQPACLHQRFATSAQQRPDAVALTCESARLTYAELDAQANRLARRLIALGVRPETRVGIAMQRSVEMVVGLLAILKAGGAYVPLDPDYPADRLAHMVADSGISLVLTQAVVRERLPGAAALQVLEIDLLDLSGEPDTDPQVDVSPDSLAYVIYTSGSTGRPKGAQLSHRNVARLLDATDAWFGFGPDDVWTLFHSYAFDFSVWEIFGALCTGGRLVVVPYWVSRSPQDFLALLRAERVTVLNQTPSAFGQLVHAVEQDEEGGSGLALRQVIFGGEALEPESLRPWFDRFGDESPQLINMYGITETTVHVTYRQITKADLDGGRSPVGVAIPDLGLYVLDGSLNLLPQGVAGELYVAGEGLARGYLNRQGLTAERFIANPFSETGERLYRTGDLVRWNAQGELEYLGRADQQVKIRGFRIELGEVQSQLLAQPEVREAVVLAKEGARLIAYVSLRDVVEESQLKQRLGQALPDYMVPSAIVVLDALPLTANGKVDRKALPEPEMASAQQYEAPQGELEETLAKIWAEVLGVERVGRQDGFFELGGHSLLALGLLERVRAQGLRVQVRTLFQHPRLAEFAQAVRQEQQGEQGEQGAQVAGEIDVPPNGIPEGCTAITPDMLTLVALDEDEIARIAAAVPGGAANIQDIYPLAPLQEGILFHHLLQSEGDAYVTSHTLSFDSRERLQRFAESFDQVVARHDILRTAVFWEGLATPVQVVCRQARLPLSWLEEGGTAASSQDALARLAACAQGYRIDLRKAPLIHLVAAHDAPGQRWLLQILAHHMVDDNTTLKQVIGEIALIQQGRSSALPRPLPFRQFVAQARSGEGTAGHEAFFRAMLGDVQEPTAPFGLLDVQGDGARTNEVRQVLDGGLAARLRQQSRRHGVSAAALFHLAWALVLARTSGRDDVVFGTVLFGRMQAQQGAARALGMFINTLPLRVRLAGRGVAQALRQTQSALTDLLQHEHASLSMAQSCSGLAGGAPLFTALLNYRHTALQDADAGDAWSGVQILQSHERTNFPFGLSVNDTGEGFTLIAHVIDAVNAHSMCGYMHEALDGLADALARDPGQPVTAIAVLPAHERDRLLQWSLNGKAHPEALPVHREFEARVREQPDAVCLVHGDEALTSARLNARANRLAHRLMALGVGPDVRVGVALERSVDMVAGLLAVLKAGGAYVPLDMEYPVDRLAYIAQDSGIALLLTERKARQRLPFAQALNVVELDDLDLDAGPDHNPGVVVHGDHLAYVIYTSGSTGRPKGAANRHAALSNCMAWMQDHYRLTRADAVLHKAAFGFDVSAWEIFWPLTAGVRLVVARPGDHRDPERIVALIRRHQITTLNFVPAMLQAFLSHEGIEEETRLRYVICGGEAMPAETQREALRRLHGVSLQNLYGPTEAAIHVTHWTCRDDGRSPVPIGRPVSATKALVLGQDLGLVPAGVAGELYLGGQALAQGYLGRPGLSAERFVADPFDQGGGRLYRTGDLVRWNDEGQLEYLGRLDHQVKIRGFRIELGEIEARLLAQPQVRESVVVARKGPAGMHLAAYVSAHEGQQVTAAELRERLALELPDYMVPAAIMVLDRLPLNANGKVDRAALPEPELLASLHYEAPVGDGEQRLAALWSEVLGVERVGRHDHFFELGGHSLLALKLLERMRAQGWVTQVRTLFQHPRLADLALALRREQGLPRHEVQVPPNGIPEGCTAITPDMLTLVAMDVQEIARVEAAVPGGAANIQDIYPLAPLQEGILFHHTLHQQGDAYATPTLLGFDTRERLLGFVQRLNQVIARHDILRTAVLWEGLVEPVQVVCRQAQVLLDWLDESEKGSEGEVADVAGRLQAVLDPRVQRIDVRRAPMIRAVAAQDAPNGRWLLQLLTHHLVLDHTTLERIVEEIALMAQGREAELPRPLPFRRFVAQARLGVSTSEHEDFFRAMLGDVDEPTAPFGLLDVQGDGSAVQEARLALDEPLARSVRRQAQRHGVSAASLFHLAWALVLGRTTGKDDVVFGTVLFGRMQGGEGAHSALGMFINTLPLRIRLGGRLGGRSVQECLRQTHELLTGLMHHEHATLSLAQRCSALAGGTPLFSALLNYRYSVAPQEGIAASAWEGMTALGGQERTNYPVTVSIDDLGEGFGIVAQADAALGAERLCGYMAAAVASLVHALESEPGLEAAALDMLDGKEWAQLQAWSLGARAEPGMQPVHQLIERQVQARPDAVALVLGDQVLSYDQLNRRANQLAHRLMALGVRPETRVGIAMERSIEMVVGLLAIMKAGGAYVPLDPDHPPERLAQMIEDGAVRRLLTHSALRERLPAGEDLQWLDIDRIDVAGESQRNPVVAVHGEHLAYVIFTSGSTGRPKGAANRHAALHNRLAWMQQAYALDASDAVLQKTPFSFDVSVWEFFWPLMAGARLVMAAPGDHRDPARLVALITGHGVTTVHFVPSMLQAFVAHAGVAACTGLRRILCSGEALPAEAQNAVFRLLPGAGLYNLYGPTEAAIDVTHWRCRDDGRLQVPIGRPISGIRTYVLDCAMRPAPQGVAGELYLGGMGLARGYLNRPALTAERFVADPLDTQGGLLYRTGDLVRWNVDGQIEYLGRLDHQVKIRGLRIELGEIEAHLLAQPGVREAVVVAAQATSGAAGARLVAYVAGPDADAGLAETLRQALARRLPDYMQPSAIVVLPALALNANGKVDRKALPQPEWAQRGYEPPHNGVEQQLSAIWAELLGQDRVGRRDNFFELGGHSLLAMGMLERMRAQGLSASVRSLFQHPQLADFAAQLMQADSAAQVQVPPNGIPEGCTAITPAMLTLAALDVQEIARVEAAVPGGAANIQDIYPLAPLQEGILFHHTLHQQGDAYATPTLLGFDTRERLLGFVQRLNRVIARHDILRTAVLWEGLAEPVQVVWRQAQVLVDWLEESEGEAEGTDVASRLQAVLDPRVQRIDVRRAPMIRAVAAQDAPHGRWLLQLLTHHLVLDHTTLERIVEEIALMAQGREAELPRPLPFRRFVAQARLGVSTSEHEDFFRAMLGDVDEPTAPFGLLDVQGDGSAVEEARLALDAPLSRELRRQAQRHGVSAASLFHLAWALVLGRTTGKDDVVFGTVLFGRMQGGEGAHSALGMFINTLPLRIHLGGRSVQECLRQTHELLTGLMHHEHATLSLAQRCSALAGGTPLFSALLNYRYSVAPQEGAAADAASGAWEGMTALGGQERTNYPLDMSIDDLGQGFRLVGQASKAVGAQRLCAYMLAAVEGIVAALAETPALPACDIELLDRDEWAQLTQWAQSVQSGCNPPRRDAQPLVHRLFEHQVDEQPQATALVFGDECISYAQLNRRANRLAHRLIAEGVGAEVRVGIAVERSVEMVVAVLAVLKSGAAYVPLDPGYPAERLAHMVEDSGMACLLTQSRLGLEVAGRVKALDLDAIGAMPGPDHNPGAAVHGECLAYVIYTSGSTGRPKGVGISHRCLAEQAQLAVGFAALSPQDRVLQFATLNFDGCIEQLFAPLVAGAAMVLRGPELWDSATFHRELMARQISVADLTTAYWLLLVQDFARQGLRGYGRLRQVHVGGEAMPGAGLQAWRDAGLGHVRLLNAYGPTEATVTASLFDCTGVVEGAGAVPQDLPIGRPLAGRHMWVVDDRMRPVPLGVAGELCIGGPLLSRGYLNRAGLSAERFVADPFGRDGARLYRTGDLVRWNAQGQLEYLGRVDHQVKIRGLRIELGEVQAQLLALDDVREAVVVAGEGPAGTRLLAYVSARSGRTLDEQEMRERLATVLPDYMVPGAIMVLDQLPQNANGKLDRQALPAFGMPAASQAPEGELEALLARIWAEVLGLEQVGRSDNFFALGGDSILSLQIVSRLRRFGWKLSPRQLFERQSIAELARVAEPVQDEAVEQETPVQGSVPLLPIQAEFFETDVPQRSHWNQALLLRSMQPLQPAPLRQALADLLARHDSLRLRFRPTAQGAWEQAYASPSEADLQALLWVRQARDAGAIEDLCEQAQRSLDIVHGPLLRGLCIEVGDGSWRLLLVAHHLVVDGVSWRILLEDLRSAYASRLQGLEPARVHKTASYQRWSQALQAHAAQCGGELAFWQALAQVPAVLPCARPEGANTLAWQSSVELRLDRERTEALISRAPAAYRTQINDILLAALGRALCAWSGQQRILVDLEGHGREELSAGVDVSRTVGWFTSVFPVALDAGTGPGDALKRVKQSLREVPLHGLGHGVLKYLGTAQQRQAMQALPQASLVFNYLGQFDASFDSAAQWLPAAEGSGMPADASAPLSHEFTINGRVYDGELVMTAAFSTARHDTADVQAWMGRYRQELEGLIDHCLSGAQGVTPSDFPLARITQAQLDGLALPAGNLADLYPLSPMQSGMLFHSLSDPSGLSYVTQLRIDAHGLDAARFRKAWQAVLDRHAVLRSGFLADASLPLQWVARQVLLDITEHDCRHSEDVAGALDALAAGQFAAFDLRKPPLMRLALVRVSDGSHHCIWTAHHLLTDGWSSSSLLGEVLRDYKGIAVEPVDTSYRDYIAWLQGLDHGASEAYWRRLVQPLHEPSLLVDALARPAVRPGALPAARQGHHEAGAALDAGATQQLVEFAQRERVTANTLVQAAWSLVLARYTGQATVAFGATVAGRPPELAGVERMQGLFINTLPVVVACDGALELGPWLRTLQAQNLASREHEQTSLSDIQRWAGKGQRGLFDSILVFENYPMDAVLSAHDDPHLRFAVTHAIDVTSYPMDLEVRLGDVLSLKMIYQKSSFGDDTVQALLRQLVQVLESMASEGMHCLRDIALLPEPGRDGPAGTGTGTDACRPPFLPVHACMALQARRDPGAVALVMGEQTISHGELQARSNHFANRLVQAGVGRGAIVGIAMERSLEMVICLLSVLKAGAAYLPLDPASPAERQRFMLADSGASHLIAHRAALHKLGTPAVAHLVVAEEVDFTQACNAAPAHAVHERDLAYVIYTSGSTGQPKGVVVEHGPLAMHCAATAGIYGMRANSRELHFMSFSFDGAHERWLTALSIGAGLVLREPQMWTAEQACEALRHHGISNAAFPPAYLAQIADWAAEQSQEPPPVELYVFGGEAMPKAAYDKVRQSLRPRLLINGYGPTETVVTPLIWKAEASETFDCAYAPIGRPVGERTVHILDADLHRVPHGVVGELYIGGYGLARGYLSRHGLTAERFVADPFDDGGGRLYRTGDLVREMPDGNIEYIGRADHQVKIRGFRIELGEVEKAVRAVPGVVDAAVLVQDAGTGKQLVAYVVGEEGTAAQTLVQRIRQQTGEHLPDYMLPAHTLVLPALPRLVSGKLDRGALPLPQADAGRVHVPPSTASAMALARIWQEVLGVERVGETDNFFELGGDSLLSLRMHAKVRKLGDPQLDFKLRDLLQRPTIAGLLELRSAGAGGVGGVVALNAVCEAAPPLFCVHAGFGTVFDYQPLARALQDRRTVHAIPCRSLGDPGYRDRSLEQMADDYCAMVRQVQPAGPYHLLGWSLGGSLAALIAARLEAQGQTVGFLGLVDPFVPAGDAAGSPSWWDDFRLFVSQMLPLARIEDLADIDASVPPRADLLAAALGRDASRQGPGGPSGHACMDGADLAQAFLTTLHLKHLALQAQALAPVQAAASLWWSDETAAGHRLRLAHQLRQEGAEGVDRAEGAVIRADHYAIMRNEGLTAEILDALALEYALD